MEIGRVEWAPPPGPQLSPDAWGWIALCAAGVAAVATARLFEGLMAAQDRIAALERAVHEGALNVDTPDEEEKGGGEGS